MVKWYKPAVFSIEEDRRLMLWIVEGILVLFLQYSDSVRYLLIFSALIVSRSVETGGTSRRRLTSPPCGVFPSGCEWVGSGRFFTWNLEVSSNGLAPLTPRAPIATGYDGIKMDFLEIKRWFQYTWKRTVVAYILGI